MVALFVLVTYFMVGAVIYGVAKSFRDTDKRKHSNEDETIDETIDVLATVLWPLSAILFILYGVSCLAKIATNKIRQKVSAHWIP